MKEALLWGAEVRTVVATAGVDLPELPLGVRQVEVPAEVMKSLSPMETPQGTLFTCAIHAEPLPETLAGRRYVVLDTLQDPGNVGTILRTADAFHADGMFLVNGCADLYNPKTLRATMGAVFRCPVWTVGAEELSALLKKERHSSLRRGAAGGYSGRPCGGLQPLRHCHRQRGPGADGERTGPLRPDHQNSYERALRIVERGGGSHGAAVGGRPE